MKKKENKKQTNMKQMKTVRNWQKIIFWCVSIFIFWILILYIVLAKPSIRSQMRCFSSSHANETWIAIRLNLIKSSQLKLNVSMAICNSFVRLVLKTPKSSVYRNKIKLNGKVNEFAMQLRERQIQSETHLHISQLDDYFDKNARSDGLNTISRSRIVHYW